MVKVGDGGISKCVSALGKLPYMLVCSGVHWCVPAEFFFKQLHGKEAQVCFLECVMGRASEGRAGMSNTLRY